MLFAASFSIFIGFLMITQWAITVLTGSIVQPGQDRVSGRGRREMLFHLSAELVTAAGLIAGGIGLALAAPWAEPVYLLASGMLLYTVINSPGFFAQQGKWPYVIMFIIILLLTVSGLMLVLV